ARAEEGAEAAGDGDARCGWPGRPGAPHARRALRRPAAARGHRARPGDAALALARRRAHGQPRFGAKIRDPRPPSPHESRAGRHRRDGDPRTRDGRAGGAEDRLSRRPRGKRREASAAGGADGVILSILAMAFRDIRRQKMRSALTTLGIVIGVGSVVALVTVWEASSAKVRAD